MRKEALFCTNVALKCWSSGYQDTCWSSKTQNEGEKKVAPANLLNTINNGMYQKERLKHNSWSGWTSLTILIGFIALQIIRESLIEDPKIFRQVIEHQQCFDAISSTAVSQRVSPPHSLPQKTIFISQSHRAWNSHVIVLCFQILQVVKLSYSASKNTHAGSGDSRWAHTFQQSPFYASVSNHFPSSHLVGRRSNSGLHWWAPWADSVSAHKTGWELLQDKQSLCQGRQSCHVSSMAAGARNTSTGTRMGSHPPTLLVALFLKQVASPSPSSSLGAPRRLGDVCIVFKDHCHQNLLEAQTEAGILSQTVQTVNRTLTFDKEGVISHCWDSHSGQKSFLHIMVQLEHQIQAV